jgi:hypothetical protein
MKLFLLVLLLGIIPSINASEKEMQNGTTNHCVISFKNVDDQDIDLQATLAEAQATIKSLAAIKESQETQLLAKSYSSHQKKTNRIFKICAAGTYLNIGAWLLTYDRLQDYQIPILYALTIPISLYCCKQCLELVKKNQDLMARSANLPLQTITRFAHTEHLSETDRFLQTIKSKPQ